MDVDIRALDQPLRALCMMVGGGSMGGGPLSFQRMGGDQGEHPLPLHSVLSWVLSCGPR